MKRLVGGDYQLDLSPIEIEESVDGETYTSITDKSVLDQLTGLKSFIGKSGMIKPIWIKLLNGETDEIVVTRGSLSTSDGVTFLIRILLVGFILTLSVEFTQMLNENDEPLDDWYIDTNDAKYILISDTQSLAGELADFEGDVSITGDLSVTGKINGVSNPSVKPIYWHGLDMYKSSVNSLQAHILKNDNTPINSAQKIIDWVKSLGVVELKLACCGTLRIQDEPAAIVNKICHFIRFNLTDGEITSINAYYCTDTGYSTMSMTVAEFLAAFPGVSDTSNKIN